MMHGKDLGSQGDMEILSFLQGPLELDNHLSEPHSKPYASVTLSPSCNACYISLVITITPCSEPRGAAPHMAWSPTMARGTTLMPEHGDLCSWHQRSASVHTARITLHAGMPRAKSCLGRWQYDLPRLSHRKSEPVIC